MHEINIQNIELEDNFSNRDFDGGIFYTINSDIVTITNLTVRNHSPTLFWLESVLTQKFYNCTFINITSSSLNTIFSSRKNDDIGRENTEQPVTIFQDFHIDVTLEYIIFN